MNYRHVSAMGCVVNSYASELETIVNEPVNNNGNSYFIL